MENCTNSSCISIREDRDRLVEQYKILWDLYDKALSKLEYPELRKEKDVQIR